MEAAVKRGVMVVAAEKELRERLCRQLEEWGWRAEGAAGADQALAMIEQGSFDFTLCSSALPAGQCREVCELLHEFSASPPRVVLLVAENEPDPQARRQEMGADAVCLLPLSRPVLEEVFRLLEAAGEFSRRVEELGEENRLLSEKLEEERPGSGRLLRFALFRSVLSAEVKKAQRYGYPLSLLVLAVDRFRELAGWLEEKHRKKYFDDFFEQLARRTREIDIAVSFADKLLVLMPHTAAEGAAVVADRMRERVAESRPPPSLRSLKLTVSIAVAATGGGEQVKFGEMVGLAMRGLKEAETKGGNLVMVCRTNVPAQPAAEPQRLGPRIFFL